MYQIVRGNFPPIPTDRYSKGLSDLVNALLVRDTAQRPSLQQVRLGRLGWCGCGRCLQCWMHVMSYWPAVLQVVSRIASPAACTWMSKVP